MKALHHLDNYVKSEILKSYFQNNILDGQLFGLMWNGVWRHFVAMVTQILVKCAPFKTFIFVLYTGNIILIFC